MSSIELSLLGKLVDPGEVSRVWDIGLRAEVFEDPINRTIFSWIIDYWMDSAMALAPTPVVLKTEFPSVSIPYEAEESTDWMVEHLKRRWVINQGQEIIRTAITGLSREPTESLDQMWRQAYDACQVVTPRVSRVDMADTVQARRHRYAMRNQHTDIGMTLGLPEVDRHTRGVLPGELAAVAAYTKIGKSWMLANAAVATRRAGYTPLLMSLEVDIDDMQDRIDALFSGVSYTHVQEGSMTFEEARVMAAAQEELADLGPFYLEKPAPGERTVKHMTSRARQLGAEYLIIDQLSWMDAEKEYRGEKATTAKHGDLIMELKDEISRESAGKLPCLLAVQLNRETVRDKASAGRGGLHNFAHSASIEQTCDLALGLWRNTELRASNGMGLDVMGSRRCDLNNWLLSWHLHNRTEISVQRSMTT